MKRNKIIIFDWPNPSRIRPDDNSIVRNPCSFGVGVENEVTLVVGTSITAGLENVVGFCTWDDVWFVDGKSLIFIWTLSVVKTAGGCDEITGEAGFISGFVGDSVALKKKREKNKKIVNFIFKSIKWGYRLSSSSSIIVVKYYFECEIPNKNIHKLISNTCSHFWARASINKQANLTLNEIQIAYHISSV